MNIINTNKKAVIYCRVSTKEQVEEGNSLNTQEKLCKEYALKNGYDVAEIFIEQGESAKTAQRTELQRLFNYCADRKNGISAAIAYKIDRISRNTDDYSYIRLLLKRYGVEIKSTSEYFENTPAGRFMENIIANVAQFDNDVRTERSVGGMKEAMREGRYVWHAPVGYINMKVAGKSTIVQTKDAALILKAFALIASNTHSIDSVRRSLFKEGLKNKSGNPITKSYFHKMLKNKVYAGWIIKFGERHKGHFETIVSQELFDQVQLVLKHRTRRMSQYEKENPDFPLRRFVTLTNGKRLSGAWSRGRNKKYPYYSVGAGCFNLRKEILEAKFVDFVNQFSLSKTLCHKFLSFIKENAAIAINRNSKELSVFQKQILDLKSKEKALIQKNLDGVISDNILRQQLSLIEQETLNLNASILKIPKFHADIDRLISFAKEFLENPGFIWLKANFSTQLKLQWFNFPKGVVFDGEKFRTTEIASVLKAKSFFLTQKSSNVPLKTLSLNQQDKGNIYYSQQKVHIPELIYDLENLVEILEAKN